MTQQQLKELLEKNEIFVHTEEENGKIVAADIEMFTKAGVNFLMYIRPVHENAFIESVNLLDIDEEIETQRQDKHYCSVFSIRDSVKDFEALEANLFGIVDQIREANQKEVALQVNIKNSKKVRA